MKSSELTQRAFEDAAIGIALIAVEPLGKYLEVNRTFCCMTGYSREELLARDFQSITVSQDVNKNLEQIQVLLAGTLPALQLEKRYIRKDGSSFWARLNVSLVRDNRRNPTHFIVQIEDIDERKRAEGELREVEDRETTFKVHLPSTYEPTVTVAKAAGDGTVAGGNETILFVDDEKSIRRLGQAILERHGYTALLAGDGKEAIEVFKRERQRIRLVILDLTMPHQSGKEVLRHLRSIEPGMKIIVSTGHLTDCGSIAVQELDADGFVPKPYHPADLLRTVRTLLEGPVRPSA